MMAGYGSVKEKAAKWRISEKYIMHLCKNKYIDGAINCSGEWLIPDNAVNPIDDEKLNSLYLIFTGTKKKIFYVSAKLFADKFYDIVTIKDIADEVGIKKGSIYNHFNSKREILDALYDFCCHFYFVDRPLLEDLDPILKNGSLLEIIESVNYEYNEEYRELMLQIIKIITQRKHIDKRANELSRELIIGEKIKFNEAVFNRGIEIGRLAPFDVHALAIFCACNRFFLIYNWAINPSPENVAKLIRDERTLNKYAIMHLTDLNGLEKTYMFAKALH